MNCQEIRDQLGAYVDGELPPASAADVGAHLAACGACSREYAEIRALAEQLGAAAAEGTAPPGLWTAIERGLDRSVGKAGRLISLGRRGLAIAAGFALLAGTVTFVVVLLSGGVKTVRATQIDYGMLLDGVQTDTDAAVQRFLACYRAERIEPEHAAALAPRLRFAVPAELPYGYRREAVYRLRLGRQPGVVACYRRADGEPLVCFFHPPVHRDHAGAYEELPCIIGPHRCHQIEVGRWRLVHFTDPTTCHCVLSTLQPEAQLPPVMAAVAPGFDGRLKHDH